MGPVRGRRHVGAEPNSDSDPAEATVTDAAADAATDHPITTPDSTMIFYVHRDTVKFEQQQNISAAPPGAAQRARGIAQAVTDTGMPVRARLISDSECHRHDSAGLPGLSGR